MYRGAGLARLERINATLRGLAARHDRDAGPDRPALAHPAGGAAHPGDEDQTAGRRQRLGIVLPLSEAELDVLDTASN